MKIHITKTLRKGYTIVETVIAVSILAVGLGGLMGSFGYGFIVMQLVRENERATQILLEKVEIIRLYNWDQVNTSGFIPTSFTDVYDPKSQTAPGVTYHGTLTISDFPTGSVNYAPKVKQLVVTLSWTTMDRVQHTRNLATLIAKDGIQNYVY